MDKKIYRLLSWLNHSLSAGNTHGHGIHSPKLFDFVQYVIDSPYPYYDYRLLERYRQILLADNTILSITDYGTGVSGDRSVKSIAATSLATARQAQLVYRLVDYTHADNILELGTSLALTTAYMSRARKKTHITTVEGCEQIAARANKTLKDLKCDNVSLKIGNINDILEEVVQEMPKIDILYIDANHTSQAMQRYFSLCLPKMHDDTVVIVDDIYWSEDMTYGWRQICEHQSVTTAFNLYHCGWLFLDKHLPKKQYKLRIPHRFY